MIFATFMTNNGLWSGIVIRENHHTVVVKPVSFRQKKSTQYAHQMNISKHETTRHRKKDHVTIYPEGVIPVHGIVKKSIEINPEHDPSNFPVTRRHGRYGWGSVKTNRYPFPLIGKN